MIKKITKQQTKLINTIKTFLKFLKVKNKNNVVKHIDIIIASLKDWITVMLASKVVKAPPETFGATFKYGLSTNSFLLV